MARSEWTGGRCGASEPLTRSARDNVMEVCNAGRYPQGIANLLRDYEVTVRCLEGRKPVRPPKLDGHSAHYQKAEALAKERGFPNYAAMRKAREHELKLNPNAPRLPRKKRKFSERSRTTALSRAARRVEPVTDIPDSVPGVTPGRPPIRPH